MDEADFESWYLREHPRVVSAITAITGRPSIAADAADEAFTRACERWDRVGTMTSPGGWAHRTALNVARRRLRRADHEHRLLRLLWATDTREAAPPAWSAEMWSALRQLPRREREVVVLRHVADLTLAEVADVLGIKPGTVSSTLTAGRSRLARLLREPEPERQQEASDA